MGLKDIDWAGVGRTVLDQAPLVGGLLFGRAGEAVGALIASTLGVDPSPRAVDEALRENPEALQAIARLEAEHREQLTRMGLEAETARLAEVNQTMRAEAAADDPWVRRWRPGYGYMVAITWGVQTGAIAWSIVGHPANAADIIDAVTALTPMWGIALAILGVNVTKRSQDKQVAAGQAPVTLASLLARR